jgi:hypothetical protein
MDNYERLTEAFLRLGLDDIGAKVAAHVGEQKKTPAATPKATAKAVTSGGTVRPLREMADAPMIIELREDTAQNWNRGVPRC